jgi:predicted flavoprotein YhiN
MISIKDRIFVIKCYYSSNESATAALRKFKNERNLIKDPFTTYSIKRLVAKFEETGSTLDKKKSGRQIMQDDRCPAFINALQDEVSELGCSSTRRISDVTNVPHSSVYRIIRNKLCLFPYRIKNAAAVETHRRPNSIAFC